MKYLNSVLVLSIVLVVSGCDDNDSKTSNENTADARSVQNKAIFLQQIGRYESNQFNQSAAEIVSYDAISQRLFVVNANAGKVDVLNVAAPSNPIKIANLNAGDHWEDGAEINSVDVKNGILAAAVENKNGALPGKLLLFNTSDLSFVGASDVGVLPDNVTFTPDGLKVLVANEGEPLSDYSIDPEGSITIVDVSNPSQPVSKQITFTDFNQGQARHNELPPGVRIYGNYGRTQLSVTAFTQEDLARLQVSDVSAVSVGDVFTLSSTQGDPINYWVTAMDTQSKILTLHDEFDKDSNVEEATSAGLTVYLHDGQSSVAQDLEPEYISVSEDGTLAMVTLQENNAMAKIDIINGSILAIFDLGVKDHNLIGNELDASDKDGGVNIQRWPVMGLYQPDSIASFTQYGQNYFITANEGDTREYQAYVEEIRFKDAVDLNLVEGDLLDNAFSEKSQLGRLLTTLTNDSDGNGLLDQAYSIGARSFTIWNENGIAIFDSGSEFELLTAKIYGQDFNNGNDDQDGDSRSDAKGPEPEAIAVGVIDDRTYAFIGLERMGGIMVYDVSNPYHPSYVQYLNNRDFSVDISDIEDGTLAAGDAGDLGPEGFKFISAQQSPNGKALLVVANEVSGTTTLYQINH